MRGYRSTLLERQFSMADVVSADLGFVKVDL